MKRLAYSKPFLIVAFLRQDHRDLNSRLCSFRGQMLNGWILPASILHQPCWAADSRTMRNAGTNVATLPEMQSPGMSASRQ